MKEKKILSNAAWIIGCKIVKAVLTMVVTMIVSRKLGPTGYGSLNYVISLVGFITPIMFLGIDSILVHEIVIHPDKEGESLGTAIVLNLISGVLCMAVLIGFVFYTNPDDTIKLQICIIYSFVLLFQACEQIRYWFFAKLMARYIAIAMLVSYVIIAIAQIILVSFHCDIRWITVVYAVDYLNISIILTVLYLKKGKQKFAFSKIRAQEMLSQSKYYIVAAMMVAIFARTDTIMISLMIGDTQAGYYTAATTCSSMTSFVFLAILDSARPYIFERLDKGDSVGFEDSVSKLYAVIGFFSLGQCIAITALAPFIIRIMYGASYMNSVPALRIAVWYTTFSYFGSVRNIWMLAKGLQKYIWKINSFGAIFNIVLNTILIPIFGIEGAAVASLITQFFTNVIIGFIMRPIRDNNKLMMKGMNPKNIGVIMSYSKDIIVKRKR